MLTLKRKTDMINAWSLLGSVLDGTLDEEYPIKSMEDEELNPYAVSYTHLTLPTKA